MTLATESTFGVFEVHFGEAAFTLNYDVGFTGLNAVTAAAAKIGKVDSIPDERRAQGGVFTAAEEAPSA